MSKAKEALVKFCNERLIETKDKIAAYLTGQAFTIDGVSYLVPPPSQFNDTHAEWARLNTEWQQADSTE